MKLKRIFCLFVVLIIATALHAQQFRVKTGLNLSNMLLKDNDGTYSDDFKTNPGFHVGVSGEFPLNEMFSFETGLLLSTKGLKFTQVLEIPSGVTTETNGDLNLFYLDVPLTAKAYFNIGHTKIYGALGPYMGIGLSGKNKYEKTEEGETSRGEIIVSWGSDKSDYKRLDYGLTAGSGIVAKSFQIGLFYSLGLANISNQSENDVKFSNRVLGLSLGYKFN